ncbi:hypothetical protein D3C79_963940 [compost metagenome]
MKNALQNVGSFMNISKYVNPTHSDPKILGPPLYFRKAIMFPAIGAYLKIIK